MSQGHGKVEPNEMSEEGKGRRNTRDIDVMGQPEDKSVNIATWTENNRKIVSDGTRKKILTEFSCIRFIAQELMFCPHLKTTGRTLNIHLTYYCPLFKCPIS